MMKEKRLYLDTFRVDEPALDRLIEEGRREGGDYCDLFFEDTTWTDLLLRDGQVASGGFHVDHGVGIRVLQGEKTGYAYSERTELPLMLEAAKAASAISMSSAIRRPFRKAGLKTVRNEAPEMLSGFRIFPERMSFPDRYPFRADWRTEEARKFVPLLERLERLITAKDPRIVKVIVRMSSQVSDILQYNSFREMTFDTRPLASLAVSVIFSQGNVTENKSVSRSFRTGPEMLTEELLLEIAEDAVRGIDERFAAKRPEGGEMPVVMGSGASGILLHEAMGHAFEADFNRKGQSIFSDRMGQKVCDARISIVDDGTLPSNRGAVNYDDEGVPGQKTYMVREGVLRSYLHDRISARFYGVSPTGNGRRESFRYPPLPRMRATYMESGDADPADIIASVKRGIYVDEFSNGQVQIGEGDFTFFVKSGSLIENGRLTRPVKDINIIGNGPRALADIAAVGNDLKIDEGAWTCGKGQSCPVSCGIPTVLVDHLIVGGE